MTLNFHIEISNVNKPKAVVFQEKIIAFLSWNKTHQLFCFRNDFVHRAHVLLKFSKNGNYYLCGMLIYLKRLPVCPACLAFQIANFVYQKWYHSYPSINTRDRKSNLRRKGNPHFCFCCGWLTSAICNLCGELMKLRPISSPYTSQINRLLVVPACLATLPIQLTNCPPPKMVQLTHP